MKVYKTFLSFDDDEHGHIVADTVEFGGKLWLVPEWTETGEEGSQWPKRLICLDDMPYGNHEVPGIADFFLQCLLPRPLWNCQTPRPPQTPCNVIDDPPRDLAMYGRE